MSIEKLLSNKILSHRKTNTSTIVSVCGAADLGKSHLSQNMVKVLRKQNLTANHLTMDSYLMSRTLRHKKGLSGYEIAAYDKELALKNLTALKSQKPIDFYTYNHKEGKKSNTLTTMNPSDILFFDGLHSMHSLFIPYIDISIFLFTEDEYLKKIRSEADLIKRNYTPEFSKTISARELNLYKTNIEPYKENAHYRVFLESKWNYKLI